MTHLTIKNDNLLVNNEQNVIDHNKNIIDLTKNHNQNIKRLEKENQINNNNYKELLGKYNTTQENSFKINSELIKMKEDLDARTKE